MQSGGPRKSPDGLVMDSSCPANAVSDTSVGTPWVPVSQGGCRTPCRGPLQTTEIIYRTESIQRSLFSSPNAESLDAGNPQAAVGRQLRVPDSQSSAGIVPFSSIRHQVSPTRCSTPADNFTDFAIMSGMIQNEQETSEALKTTEQTGELQQIASQVADSQ